MDKKLIGLIGISIIIAVVTVSGCIGDSSNTNEDTSNTTNSSISEEDLIGEEKATEIFKKNVGSPIKKYEVNLKERDGKQVYSFLYTTKDNRVGVMPIDAVTGEVLD